MKIIRSEFISPYYNFALEELLLKNEFFNNEDILLIYQNENAIIVGKNQNTHEEINDDYVKEKNITIARRLSGGGAVYHDKGNVNFCFITNKSDASYSKFLEPIIGFLKSLGLEAEFAGKNDVMANGYKISGNAQYKYKDRMFHHGTLLFNADLSVLTKALKPNILKLESKAIKSIRQRVSNIKELLVDKITTEDFIKKLIIYFENEGNKVVSHDVVPKEEIEALAKMKSKKEWNFGRNPPFDLSNHKRFSGGTIKLNLSTDSNKIKSIKIEGDFLSSNNFEDVYAHFIGKPYDILEIESVVNSIDNFKDYFGKISKQELLSLFKGLE